MEAPTTKERLQSYHTFYFYLFYDLYFDFLFFTLFLWSFRCYTVATQRASIVPPKHTVYNNNNNNFLTSCPSLEQSRLDMFDLWKKQAVRNPILYTVIMEAMSCSTEQKCQFLLDCSTLASVINLVQTFGDSVLQDLFYITRTYCYVLHRERARLLQNTPH